MSYYCAKYVCIDLFYLCIFVKFLDKYFYFCISWHKKYHWCWQLDCLLTFSTLSIFYYHIFKVNTSIVLGLCTKIRQSTIWYAGLLGQMNRPPSVWCFKQFFYSSYRLRALKTLYFCKFIKKCIKNTLQPFLQRVLQKIVKKNNTWNVRRLVGESFVSKNQQTSILYCRLSDFWSLYKSVCTLALKKKTTKIISTAGEPTSNREKLHVTKSLKMEETTKKNLLNHPNLFIIYHEIVILYFMPQLLTTIIEFCNKSFYKQ